MDKNNFKERCSKLIDLRILYNYFTNFLFIQNSHINSYSDGPFVRWVDWRIPGISFSRPFFVHSSGFTSVPYIVDLCCLRFLLVQYSKRLLFYSSILMIFIFWLANSFFIVDIFLLFTKSPPRTIFDFFALNSFQNVQE